MYSFLLYPGLVCESNTGAMGKRNGPIYGHLTKMVAKWWYDLWNFCGRRDGGETGRFLWLKMLGEWQRFFSYVREFLKLLSIDISLFNSNNEGTNNRQATCWLTGCVSFRITCLGITIMIVMLVGDPHAQKSKGSARESGFRQTYGPTKRLRKKTQMWVRLHWIMK
jgi:hypothetical protein